MTNGEKIKEIFPDTKIITQYDNPFGDRFMVFKLNNEDMHMQVNIDWWNAEYKEPITNNDLALIHTEGLDEEIRCTMCTNYMKSDRGCDGSCVVNKDMYKAVMDAIEKRIQSTTENDLTEQCIACKYDETEDENGEHCKKCLEGDSQFELDNEFVESITKNDLEVDYISRADAIQAMQDTAKKLTNEDTINGLCGAVAILFNLPSVTSEELRWVPVSERLPEKSGNYWCIFGGTNLTGSDYYTTESDAKEIFNEPEEYVGWRSQNVIAWMPLPQPQI